MITVDIRSDIEGVKNGFIGMEGEIPNVKKKLLWAVAFAARNMVRRNMGRYLEMNHRAVFKAQGDASMGPVRYKVLKTSIRDARFLSLQQRVYAFSRSDSHWAVAAPKYIAEPLERGTTIRAKKRKFLWFIGDDGQYHRAKSVQIPARHWFTRSLAGFESSSEWSDAIREAEEKMVAAFEAGR